MVITKSSGCESPCSPHGVALAKVHSNNTSCYIYFTGPMAQCGGHTA